MSQAKLNLLTAHKSHFYRRFESKLEEQPFHQLNGAMILLKLWSFYVILYAICHFMCLWKTTGGPNTKNITYIEIFVNYSGVWVAWVLKKKTYLGLLIIFSYWLLRKYIWLILSLFTVTIAFNWLVVLKDKMNCWSAHSWLIIGQFCLL
jgi:hypothetical protein